MRFWALTTLEPLKRKTVITKLKTAMQLFSACIRIQLLSLSLPLSLPKSCLISFAGWQETRMPKMVQDQSDLCLLRSHQRDAELKVLICT